MKKKLFVTYAFCVLGLLCACGGSGGMDYYEPAPAADNATPDAAPEWEEGIIIRGEGDARESLYWNEESGESYLVIDENRERAVAEESVATLSLKVDTAAYTNVARYLENGGLPPVDAVRTEEMVNYFRYDTPLEFGGEPFAIHAEVGPSPLDPGKHMAMIRVKTPEVDKEQLPASNLTFLIDTSGSMNSHDKLPLLKEAFSMLVETLDGDDTVSVVTYAGSSQVVLDSVGGDDKDRILDAIHRLQAGGSTAGANGIQTAYALAEKNRMAGGNNRVILATDGDFNVGIASIPELEDLIGEKREGGVYLSVLGFGTGNIREDIMETLSKHGNGNYAYINSVATARKVLVEELGSNLFTVADDVKAQVEFNPAAVKSYRLIGYENRVLRNRDFDDDTKDAGEIGAGTDVVVLFELELQGSGGDSLKYAVPQDAGDAPVYGDELLEVRIRYKDPGAAESKLATRPVTYGEIVAQGSSDYRFAVSVAAFGHLLRDSAYAGDVTVEDIIALAQGSLGQDAGGYRAAHLELLGRYRQLAAR